MGWSSVLQPPRPGPDRFQLPGFAWCPWFQGVTEEVPGCLHAVPVRAVAWVAPRRAATTATACDRLPTTAKDGLDAADLVPGGGSALWPGQVPLPAVVIRVRPAGAPGGPVGPAVADAHGGVPVGDGVHPVPPREPVFAHVDGVDLPQPVVGAWADGVPAPARFRQGDRARGHLVVPGSARVTPRGGDPADGHVPVPVACHGSPTVFGRVTKLSECGQVFPSQQLEQNVVQWVRAERLVAQKLPAGFGRPDLGHVLLPPRPQLSGSHAWPGHGITPARSKMLPSALGTGLADMPRIFVVTASATVASCTGAVPPAISSRNVKYTV